MSKRKQLETYMLQRVTQESDSAPLWRRLFAYAIDYFLSTILISIIPMIITSILTGQKEFTSENFTAIPMSWRIVCGVLAMAAAVYYFCVYPLKDAHKGQTPGKRIMGIRIKALDGKELSWSNMWKRELVGSLLVEGETAFPSAYLRYFVFLFLPQTISQAVYYVYMGITLCSVAWAVFGKNHQMFHDVIGKTKVTRK